MQPDETLPRYRLPPERSRWQKNLVRLDRTLIVAGSLFFASMCVQLLMGLPSWIVCTSCGYVALILVLFGLVVDYLVCYEERVFKKRVEDRSQVEWLFQEAKSLHDTKKGGSRSSESSEDLQRLEEEMKRLTDLKPQCWTEYQVLTLDWLVTDLLSVPDLKARALSGLAELREYAHGSAFSYDVNLYYDWENRINTGIKDLDEYETEEGNGENRDSFDCKVAVLRAGLKSLREHIANYQFNWARGSTIVSSIRVCGSVGVVVFLLMGILPILTSFSGAEYTSLGILNWGFLGIAGAMAGVLLGLRNTDEVEVGNTEGEKELWRAVLGIPLGMLSGVLIFAALKGGLINAGSIVPKLDTPETSDIALSILWAVVAGLGLEKVFERVRTATEI